MVGSKIDSLLVDISNRLEEGKGPAKDNLAVFLEEIKEVMENFFEESTNRDNRGKLRLSAVGREDRKLWYDYHGYEKEPLSTDARIKFCFGHLLEAFVLLLVKEAGHSVKDCQKEVTVGQVKGHIDCMIDGELVDVKSASPYGFKKFVDGSILKGDDPFGYLYQLSSYGKALKKEKGYFLSIDKSGGGLNLLEVPLDRVDPVQRITYLKEIMPHALPPARCYSEVEEASGNRKLGFNCKYCDFKSKCWEDSNNGQGLRKYNYSRGPEYFTHVQREPRVEEDFF